MKQSSSSRKPRTRNNSRKPGRNSGQSNGNRVENRVRGNPKQLLDKYKTQARDARQSGDRITAEYYYQFADHYQRIINEMRLGCGGVFEDYREPPKRLREQAEAADGEMDDIGLDDDQADGVSADGESVDGAEGDEDQQSARGSRSQRAARAEAEERHGRDGRQNRRAGGGRRRRQPVEEVATAPEGAEGQSDDPAAIDQPSIVAGDDSPTVVVDTAPLDEDIQIVAKPRGRGRPRRKPAPVEEKETAALPLDEPQAEDRSEPETDAA